MYLAPGTHVPLLVHRAVLLPVCLTAGQEDIQIQHLQQEELFPSLWISQSAAENEPARPPAPSGTQPASSILGKEKVLFLTVALALACVYWWQQGQPLLGLVEPTTVQCIQLRGDWEESAWTSAFNFSVCVVFPLQPHVKLSLNHHPGLATRVCVSYAALGPHHNDKWWCFREYYRSCAQISTMLYYMISKLKILWWWNNTSSFLIFCYSQVLKILWGHNNMVSHAPSWSVGL